MNNDDIGLQRPTRKYVSPETQAKREIAGLKAEVKRHAKLARLKTQAERLKALLTDIDDAKNGRINPFDIERAMRDALHNR